jgi:hypothetical protein
MVSSNSQSEPFVTDDLPGLHHLNLETYLHGLVPLVAVGPVSMRTITRGRSNELNPQEIGRKELKP